jgi:membrane associated rhomboid family serine protease
VKLHPEDPMGTRATDSPVEDGWRGARIGAETRDRDRRAARHIPAAIDLGEPELPRVTIAFLLVTLLVTAIEFATFGTSPSTSELSRSGGAGIGLIATGAWWKLLTSNLLHANLVHIAMNAFVIYLTGRWLEHLVGGRIVAAAIAWSMLASGVGALLVDVPTVSIGASGVAFGLVGCAMAADPRARTATGVIARQLAIFNIVATFLVPGISIGGHFGGFAAGLAVGAICWRRTPDDAQHPVGTARRIAAPVLFAAALPFALVMAIGPSVLPNEAEGTRSAMTARLLQRQLSGAELTSGLKIDEASCTGLDDVLDYGCSLDGKPALVRFSQRDDQWSLRQ